MLHISQHDGKLKGFFSLSTSTLKNPFCQKMMKVPHTICSKCYAAKLESFRDRLRGHLEDNYDKLSKPIPDSELPNLFNMKYFRINSFGELINKHHLDNIIRIAELNPQTTMALWTKRTDLLRAVNNKPANLILIVSSPYLNTQTEKPDIADKVFTVHTKDSLTEYNCSRSCAACLKCYTIGDPNTFIEEEVNLRNKSISE